MEKNVCRAHAEVILMLSNVMLFVDEELPQKLAQLILSGTFVKFNTKFLK